MDSKVLRPCFIWLFLSIASAGCERHQMTVTFDTFGGHEFSSAERRAIQNIADATAQEARRVLPALPTELVLRVDASKKVIPETGENGSAAPPNVVYWIVDPTVHGGVEAIVRAELRLSLAHEFHHLVRASSVTATTLMDEVVNEGMATAFEREFGGATGPWGAYPDNVSAWVDELLALPPTASRQDWLYQHPDGRRWIGYKAGTYLVDRAMRASGKSAAELVSTSTDEIARQGK